MSYLTGATNAQSLNGIITISDGVITISEGTISGLEEIDLNDLQVADTATIENLVVNNQIDMTSGKITNLANGTNANDAVNKSQLDLKADTTYVDTNFLNKTTATTQNVASRLTFNNTTSSSSFPTIELFNSTAGTNSGEFIRIRKLLSQTAGLEIGGLSFCSSNFSNTMRRQADLICSMNTNILPEINLKFNDGTINPLTINYGQFISRNNKQYFQKQDGTNIFNYIDNLDYVAFSKDISLGSNKIINLAEPTLAQDAATKNYTDNQTANTNYLKRDGSLAMLGAINMNTSNKITNLAEPTLAQDAATKNYTDNHSNNGNYLLRNGTLPMTGNLQMGSYKITNLLDPFDLNDGANKEYVDTQTANTYYLLRDGTLAMTGNLNLSTHNLITTGTIDCNIIDADGDITTNSNMSCADFTSNANQIIGGGSLNVLDVKSSAFFEANVLIETNKHLAFNSGDLSTINGMLMNYDSGIGYLDVRGSEFRIRTASAGVPNTIRFKVNDTNTTVRNNFFCDADCTFGNQDTDTATFNCKTTIHNILTFATGSRIDGARVQLIKSGNISYTMTDNNGENGVLCNNTSTISITLPAKSAYWNNRSYYVKVKTATVNLVQNIDTRIDNDNTTLVMSSNYRGYHLHFDSDYENSGDIWRLSQI